MELTREIYWNVGTGVLLPMYLLVAAAFGVLIYGFVQRTKWYRKGQRLNRTDDLPGRIVAAVRDLLTQRKVRRERGPGWEHAGFFFGFVLLTIGTTLVFVQADILEPLFGIRFLKGGFYLAFSLILDFAGIIAITMLLGLAVRRFIVRPEGLPTSRDDLWMHGLLLAILVTGFLIEGARMAATEIGIKPFLAAFSPVGYAVGLPMTGNDPESIASLHKAFWWVHLLLVALFFASIPFTKFRHLVTTPVNGVFVDRRRRGSIDTPDLEDESAESFGAQKITDLTWKDLFDADACTLCKRCQDRCPAYATGKPLSPMKLVNQVGEQARTNPEGSLVETVTEDVLWACTTCRACQETCPATIEHVNKILEMRRHLVLMEGSFPGEEVTRAAEQTEVNGNPLGMPFAARGEWAEGLDLVDLSAGGEADILYFVGCYASFDRRNKEVARSFVKICNAAGIKVGILGKGEKCCGEPMRKLGNEYLYQMLAQENIAAILESGVATIVTTCPHCLNTLDRDYRQLPLEDGLEFTPEVVHHSTFIDDLIKQGKIQVSGDGFECTFHDSCYLGRYRDEYEAPRSVVQAAGGAIREMDRSRVESFCCGGGGGRIVAEESIGTRISVARVGMALQTGAPELVSACPFCLTMFEDGVKMADAEGGLRPRDLAEIVAERLVTK